MPKGVYPRKPASKRPGHRTPDVCRFCQVALADTNWPPILREAGIKVCAEHRQEFYRVRNGKMKGYHRRYYVEKTKPAFDQLRAEVIAVYGGACACCSESQIDFLTIDHVNNDGNAHRKEIGRSGYAIYEWLKAHNYPREGFQVLCWNCNAGKITTGVCPHQRLGLVTSFPWAVGQ